MFYQYVDNGGLYTFINDYVVTGLVILPDVDSDYKDYTDFVRLLEKAKRGE